MYYSIKCNEVELLIFQSLMSVISSDEHFKSNLGWMVTPEEIVEKAKEKQGKTFGLTKKEAENFMIGHPEVFTKMGNYFYFHLDQDNDDPFDNKNIFSVFFGED